MILCYHGVGPTSLRVDPGFLRIRPDSFRRQLEILVEAGFEFVTVSGLVERMRAAGSPPPGLAALTFDDGMDDNHSIVRPILEEFGVTGTFYVATGLIGRANPWMAAGSRLRMMTLAELADLVDAGFEIGAHTVSHPDLSKLDYETCLREIRESRQVLEEALRIRVQSFAYPFCQYGAAALAAVRDAGLTSAVTCGTGVGSWDPHELPRAIITGKDGIPTFLLKLAGLHGPIADSPPGRIARAATRRYRMRRRREREKRAGAYESSG